MNIQPKGASAPSYDANSSNSASDSRSRAIATLMGNNASPPPVANQNSISPEEMGAIKASSKKEEDSSIEVEASENTGQKSNIESTAESSSSDSKEAKVSEDPLSNQYATLARKEKALRAKAQAQEQALKAREEAIKAQEDALKAKESEYSSKYISKDKLSQDTLNALLEAGLTYDQITEAMLSQPNPEKVAQDQYLKKLEAKIAELEGKQEKTLKSFEDQQKQAYNNAVTQIRNEVSKLVYTDPSFETIKETNSVNDVVELIEETFNNGMGEEYPKGTLLSASEAAQIIEDYLLEEALKLTKIKKIQQRLQPAAKPVLKSEEPLKQPQKEQSMKTLTNAVGSSRALSPKERAILAFKGELKS